MSAEPLPEWFIPPVDGWTADDLDRLPPEAPSHLELIDGALIVMSPQTRFHMRVINRLVRLLEDTAPDDLEIAREMTVTLGPQQRPEPDVMVARVSAELDNKLTTYPAKDILLAIEVVSAESAIRDRRVKPERYAEAGIPHFWLVEEEEDRPVVHVYELDPVTAKYVPTAVVRTRTELLVPFPLTLDPAALLP